MHLEHLPGHFTVFCARGMLGNLTGKPSRGEEFDFCLGGVGKLNRNCQVSSDFFGGEGGAKVVNSY